MLNGVHKAVAYATQLMPQISIVNLQNYIHDADYANEHNIRYAEIREFYTCSSVKISEMIIKTVATVITRQKANKKFSKVKY